MTDFDKSHLADLLRGGGDWFTAQLLRLIAKADKNNRRKLAVSFPEEVAAVCEFQGVSLTEPFPEEGGE